MRWTEQTSAGSKDWYSIASDSTGQNLAACGPYNSIYTSIDGGAIWLQSASEILDWYSITSDSTGFNLAACAYGRYIYTSTDSGATWTEQPDAGNWVSITSDSTGQYLAACDQGGYIYTFDSFVTWIPRTASGLRPWSSIASDSTGFKLAACVQGGYIYTSIDRGATWTEQTAAGSRVWTSIASDSTGTNLAACVYNGNIYTSTDSGANWTNRTAAGSRSWVSITSDSTGTKLAAGANVGYIYTSIDGGGFWTQRESARSWSSIASDSTGQYLAASVSNGYIYTSTDGGVSCFKEGSKILTDKGYVAIQDLRKGDLVKTLKNGFLPITLIGQGQINHNASNERIKDQLYRYSPDQYPELFEDLIITGRHSILVDCLTSIDQEEHEQIFGTDYMLDDKYKLLSYLNMKATVYEKEGNYTIYHFALDNEDNNKNYGVYANGLLVEVTLKRDIILYMNLIE